METRESETKKQTIKVHLTLTKGQSILYKLHCLEFSNRKYSHKCPKHLYFVQKKKRQRKKYIQMLREKKTCKQ